MENERTWMYSKRYIREKGGFTEEWSRGVEQFISFACANVQFMNGEQIRCPCRKCKNLQFRSCDEVRLHLYKWGFMLMYWNWTSHGEPVNLGGLPQPYWFHDHYEDNCSSVNQFERMVFDAVGPNHPSIDVEVEEEPNADARRFYDILASASTPLWDGCDKHSELSAAVRLLNLKSDYNMSVGCYDGIAKLMKETQPADSNMPSTWYETKKLVSRLGLAHIKIDVCVNDYMLYWKSDQDASSCKFCDAPRYKPRNGKVGKDQALKTMHHLPLIPRLQRLYASNATAEHMRWHKVHAPSANVLKHPSDAEAWRHFDRTYPWFAAEPRNVRLGLCSDGFNPFRASGRQYSCWPVIVTPYNLPPWMCMKRPYMFLTSMIPGPRNPRQKIDVYLQPLIDELKLLWDDGVETWDVSLKQNFRLRAALMWTVSDFPAYGMLSGWMTHGRLSCPICMEKSKAFTLQHGRKTLFFDCHRQFLDIEHPYRRNRVSFRKGKLEKSAPPERLTGDEIWSRVSQVPSVIKTGNICKMPGYGETHNWTKRSIFWTLPYWRTNLLPHNLDIMHIEKNVFDNIFNTVMDMKNKMKDNVKARRDMQILCNRPDLNVIDLEGGGVFKPKAAFTLTASQRSDVLMWVKSLKLPDGYASNFSRCIDNSSTRMFGMKSHDCHVFMQRLLPLLFQALPENIWKPLTELSQFFRDLCLPELHVDAVQALRSTIPIILCKLERIFPPAFFDSMEHLPVHLAYEALIGGPVQYRWMFTFERCLGNLKHRVLNKARVEGSICYAYLIEETSTFCSYYFESHIPRMGNRVPRNDDGGQVPEDGTLWKIFTYPGRPHGQSKYWFLNDMELQAATLYILLNCDEIKPYITKFVQVLHLMTPNISALEVDERIEKDFPTWLQNYVSDSANGEVSQILWDVACGPSRRVECWPVYFVNGYKFWTVAWGEGKSTYNSGVCIKCTGSANNVETEFYGVVQEIIQLEYPGMPHKNVVLFRCDWFDTTPERGTRIHKQYRIVEVLYNRRYPKYDPFILASQADQVYYTPYPSKSKEKVGWWAVLKIKARRIVNYEITEHTEAFQEEVGERLSQVIHDDPIDNLGDINVGETVDDEICATNDVMEEYESEDEDTGSTEDDEESDVELDDLETEDEEDDTDDV